MLEVTHSSTVTEDQIDHLGHMNVRYYGVNAHAGTHAFLAGLDGWPAGPRLVHDAYTRHLREQMLGTPLVVRTAVLGAGPDGIRIHHELAPADADNLAAVFVHRVGPVDADGTIRPVPAEVVDGALAAAVEPFAYAAPRTIDLEVDPLAAAPGLDLVRGRRLEQRQARTIGADECDDRGRYRPDDALMLLWGGQPPEHVEEYGPDLHEGEDGALMGWAVMETRVQLGRLPRVGTRIQSFGAYIAVHERATHRLHWCYDLDRGDVLCAFEAVNVAFDTRARRTMVIPDRFRTRMDAGVQPDLVPPRPVPVD
ncbi:MAG TPA: thioesterase family protein [Acidimicrobiales bacterium]|jgi:acyl-CoA thioesterase FadM|nr:thioesterase family protein [Acidimicrobiales bacterium]